MTFSGRTIFEYAIPEVVQSVTPTQAILYALSVGYGAEPLDGAHLRYLFEDELVSSSTLANVVAHPGSWLGKVGVDWKRLVHAEHRLTLHRTLPLGIPIACRSKTLCVVDKGPGKGLFVTFERVLSIERTGEPVATIVQTNACRGDGGRGSAGMAIEPLPPVPRTRA